MGIELRQISKRVGAEMHIYDTDLILEKGKFNVLLGTTLSGKTTLMRLMAGLEQPSSGEIWFDGKNVTGVPVQKREVAMVYQAFINYPNFTVFDNIASPLRVAKIPARQIRQRVGVMAELLQLSGMLDRFPEELSGGQQQRTALARALVKNAPLVLLDEPLANLDYKLREELHDELPKLLQDTGTTVVYATSEPLEALMLGGHTATLHEGKVTQFGATMDIYRSPNTLQSAQIFSDPPINTAAIDKQGDNFVLGDLVRWPVPEKYRRMADGSYLLGIRPHHITVYQPQGDSISIDCLVRVAEISGSESILRINFGGNTWVSESHGVHTFEVGEMTQLHLQVDRCLFFSRDGELVAN
ncbi:MAG: ABC transporter ATP-binding protein [Gammaproteobacteria bacterium]